LPEKFGGRAAVIVLPFEIRCQRNPDIPVRSKRSSSPYFAQVLGTRLCLNKSANRQQLEEVPVSGPALHGLKQTSLPNGEYYLLTALPLLRERSAKSFLKVDIGRKMLRRSNIWHELTNPDQTVSIRILIDRETEELRRQPRLALELNSS
jgi:hypothetical protein